MTGLCICGDEYLMYSMARKPHSLYLQITYGLQIMGNMSIRLKVLKESEVPVYLLLIFMPGVLPRAATPVLPGLLANGNYAEPDMQ
jgi:hypothetical protein